MMLIKTKYLATILLIDLLASGFIYFATLQTINLGIIFLGIFSGSFLGIILYLSAIYVGSKPFSKNSNV